MPIYLLKFETYEHHGVNVAVRSDLKGKHTEFCLCYLCENFHPNTEENCPIAQATFENCKKYGITTPMWECPKWIKATK